MTTENRARMRAALRGAVGKALLPAAELTHPGRFTPPPSERYDLEERFRAELTKLAGVVHDARSTDDVASIIMEVAAANATTSAFVGPSVSPAKATTSAFVGPGFSPANAPKILMWDERELPVPGLAEALRARGATILTQSPDKTRDNAHRAELATAVVGVTGADGGLAATGSIVLTSGPGRGRLASLLTPIHVAVLKRSRLFETLATYIGQHPEAVTAGANFVCITGPSRTADIEHVLARGVHGPKEIHVVMVD